MSRIGLYPGTFDPVTLGHLDIIRRGESIEFNLRANAWLQHMVRNIVGALVYVGAGRQPASWIRTILESRDRSRAAPTFAAEGLYLESVEYDPAWHLPAARRGESLLPLTP